MRKNSLYIISSLFFACVLFIYATSTNFQNNNTARQVKSETYTNTITNVPIDITMMMTSISLADLHQRFQLY